MVSHSSGDISTAEARRDRRHPAHELTAPGVKHLPRALPTATCWSGTGARRRPPPSRPMTCSGQNMAPYLNDSAGDPVPALIRRSWDLLEEHPVNLGRRQKGLKAGQLHLALGPGPAARSMPRFKDLFGLEGGVISAVDLLQRHRRLCRAAAHPRGGGDRLPGHQLLRQGRRGARGARGTSISCSCTWRPRTRRPQRQLPGEDPGHRGLRRKGRGPRPGRTQPLRRLPGHGGQRSPDPHSQAHPHRRTHPLCLGRPGRTRAPDGRAAVSAKRPRWPRACLSSAATS